MAIPIEVVVADKQVEADKDVDGGDEFEEVDMWTESPHLVRERETSETSIVSQCTEEVRLETFSPS